MANLEISVLLRAIDQLSGPLKKVDAQLDGLGHRRVPFELFDRHQVRQLEREAHRAGEAQAGAYRAGFGGGLGFGALTAAAAGGFFTAQGAIRGTIGAAAGFETQLENIGQKSNLADADLLKLGDVIRGIGTDTAQGAAETAKTIDSLVGRGATVEAATALARPIGLAASAYNAATEDLAAASISVMDTLKVDARDVGRALDIMAAGGKEGAFELRDMAAEFPSLTASAAALGIKGTEGVADLVAALEVARKGAGTGSEAANNLANFMAKIVSPETRKNLRKFGVDPVKVLAKAAEDGTSPIEAMLTTIDKITEGGRPEKLGEIFADMQVQGAIRPLLQNMQEYRRIREEALAAAGTVEADFARRLETTEGAMKRVRAQIENVGVSLGSMALPIVADGLAGISDRMNRLMTTSDSVVDRMGAAWSGLAEGLGLDRIDFGGLGNELQALDDVLFGTTADASGRMAEISASFHQLGDAVRSVASGDVAALGRLGGAITDVVNELGALGTLAAAAGVVGTASVLRLLSGAVVALAMSPIGRLTAAAVAISAVIEAAKDAGSLGEFIENIDQLDTATQAILGFVAAVGALKGLRALGRLGGAAAGVAAAGNAATAAGGAAAGAAATAGLGRLGMLGRGVATVGKAVGPVGLAFTGLQAAGAVRRQFVSPEEEVVADAVADDRRRQSIDTFLAGPEPIRRPSVPLVGGLSEAAAGGAGTAAPIVPEVDAAALANLERALAVVQELKGLDDAAAAAGPRALSDLGQMAALYAELDTLQRGMSDAMRAQLDQYAAAVRDGSTEVVALAVAMRTALVAAGTEGGAGLSGGVAQGAAGAVAAVAGAAATIAGSFDGLGARLFSSGAQAVAQLAAGMRSNAGAVAAAADAVAATAAARFPQSPAKEGPLKALPYMGAEIVRQLAGGMFSMTSHMGGAADAVAAAALPDVGGRDGSLAPYLAAVADPAPQRSPSPIEAGHYENRGQGEEGGAITTKTTYVTNHWHIASTDPRGTASEIMRILDARSQADMTDIGATGW